MQHLIYGLTIYLDIQIPAGVKKTFPVDTYRHAFAYIFEGARQFKNSSATEGILVEKEIDGNTLNLRDLSGDRFYLANT